MARHDEVIERVNIAMFGEDQRSGLVGSVQKIEAKMGLAVWILGIAAAAYITQIIVTALQPAAPIFR